MGFIGYGVFDNNPTAQGSVRYEDMRLNSATKYVFSFAKETANDALKLVASPKGIIRLLKDPLYKNSIFLIASSVTSMGSGFFFWVITARFYPASEVGLASAIIAAMGLISILSKFGLDISLARYIPERKDKQELINSSLTIAFAFSIVLALIFIAGINIWTPSLSILKENRFFFLLFPIFAAVRTLRPLQMDGIFVGFRKMEYSFVQMLVTFARIGIVPFLVTLGVLGIYIAFGLTPIFAFILGLFLTSRVLPGYKAIPGVKKRAVIDIFHFSFGNYLAKTFEDIPGLVLPIMVINIMGAQANAYFFIAWQVSTLLIMVSRWTAMSLLAEGAHNQKELQKNTRKAAKFIFLILVPAIIVILVFGRYILWIFGEDYAIHSAGILSLLVLGSMPFAFNALYSAIKRVQKETKPVIYVYGTITILTLVGSYFLMQIVGLTGIAVAWTVANGVVAVIAGAGGELRRLLMNQ